jgi:hypothetical protein
MEFVRRMKFWIGLGILVLAGGVVLGVWFVPTWRANAASMSNWEETVGDVQGLDEMTLHNGHDVKSAQDLTQALQKQLEEAEKALQAKTAILRQYLPDPDTGGPGKPLEGGLWKDAYERNMDDLEQGVRESFLTVGGDIILRQYWGEGWPTQEEMRDEAKLYWLQRYLLEALASANEDRMVVPTLSGFSLFASLDRLLNPSHGQLFRPVGFQMVITTELESVPMVLQKLLEAKVGVVVTTLYVDPRPGEAAPAATPRPQRVAAPPTAAPSPVRRRSSASAIRRGPPAGFRRQDDYPGPTMEEYGPFSGFVPYGGGAPPTYGAAPAPYLGAAARARTQPAAERVVVESTRSLVGATIRGYVLDAVPAGQEMTQ